MSTFAQFTKGKESGQNEQVEEGRRGWERGFSALMDAIIVYAYICL